MRLLAVSLAVLFSHCLQVRQKLDVDARKKVSSADSPRIFLKPKSDRPFFADVSHARALYLFAQSALDRYRHKNNMSGEYQIRVQRSHLCRSHWAAAAATYRQLFLHIANNGWVHRFSSYFLLSRSLTMSRAKTSVLLRSHSSATAPSAFSPAASTGRPSHSPTTSSPSIRYRLAFMAGIFKREKKNSICGVAAEFCCRTMCLFCCTRPKLPLHSDMLRTPSSPSTISLTSHF